MKAKWRKTSKLLSLLLIVSISISCMLILTVRAEEKSVSLTPSDDSYTQNGTSNVSKNFGTLTTMIVKDGPSPNARNSYIKFDLSSLGTSVTITRAILTITAKGDNLGSRDLVAYAIEDDSWTETTITWDNAPQMGEALATATFSSASYRAYTYDLTDYVASEMVAGDSQISIGLFCTTYDKLNTIYSRENATGKPALAVTYTEGTAVETSATITDITSIAGGYQVQYSITLSNGISNTKNVIALYNGNKLAIARLVDEKETSVALLTNDAVTHAKIFVWNDFAAIKPLCISPKYSN